MANEVLDLPSGVDITAALQAALNNTVAVGGVLTIKPGNYVVSSTVTCNIAALATTPFGVSARGVRLTSSVGNGAKVLDFNSTNTALGTRYFFLDGLQLIGGGQEGVGLSLRAENGNTSLAYSTLRDLTIEGCGGDGLQIRGNIFESQFYNCTYWNCGRGTIPAGSVGAGLSIWTTAGDSSGRGLPSAIHIHGGSYAQNFIGLATRNDTGQPAPNDIYINACYFRDSLRDGVNFANGLGALTDCGFENNWRSATTFDPVNTPHAAITGVGGIRLKNCRGLTGTGSGQTHLLQTFVAPSSYIQQNISIEDCASESEGGGTPHMAYINSSSNGALNLLNLGAVVIDNLANAPSLTVNQFATSH